MTVRGGGHDSGVKRMRRWEGRSLARMCPHLLPELEGFILAADALAEPGAAIAGEEVVGREGAFRAGVVDFRGADGWA